MTHQKKMSSLNFPHDVFVSNGEVFIADGFNNRVRKLLRNGQIVTIVGDDENTTNPSDNQFTTLLNPYSVFGGGVNIPILSPNPDCG